MWDEVNFCMQICQSFLEVYTTILGGSGHLCPDSSLSRKTFTGAISPKGLDWLPWYITYIKTFTKAVKIFPVFNECAEVSALSQSVARLLKV